ncbi:hypothetical protein, partial [Variovorax gossypii]|jgi:hypothetical protein
LRDRRESVTMRAVANSPNDSPDNTTEPEKPGVSRASSRRQLTAENGQYRKANEMVGMRAKKGRITLVTWKIHQSLVSHAQLQHQQRLRDAAKGRPMETGSFSMPLSELVASAHYGSNGLELFKDYIREMQTTLIEWNSDEHSANYWRSSQILGSVEIKSPGPPHPTILYWSFPDVVRDYVLDPKLYTRMMVDLNQNVRSLPGAVLAEIGMRYLTSPAGITNREDVAWWVTALTGRSDREMEYRYFKRDVLTPALREVDEIQGEFSLELIEHRRGRRVEELQMRVLRKSQGSLNVNEPRNFFDLNLLARIQAFGFKEQDAGQLCIQHDEGLLRRTTEALEARLRNSALPKIESPPAYFRDALKKGYASAQDMSSKDSTSTAVGSAAQALVQLEGASPSPAAKRPATKKSKADLVAEWVRALAKEAEVAFRALDAPRQAVLTAQFESEEVPKMLAAIARAWAEEGIDSRSAKHTFFRWLATRPPYEEPDSEQLLEFSLAGVLPAGSLKL